MGTSPVRSEDETGTCHKGACSKVYPQHKSQQVEEMIVVTLKHAPHREKAKTNAQVPNIRVEADLEN
ncbi:hypothetical protein ROHU_010329 [Labeo rohita]|uniref:Uncharacterized protein n=1 Tax=Labeo rohita TaxID=84645 RepID=A0A498M2Z8_LABRO|nr:hypothetical protein ROHU_010329 [Labeo rohita]